MKNWIPISISTLALVWSVGWTYYTYNKFLPLSESNVVFSQDDIVVTPNASGQSVNIIPKIRNIGKADAQNIEFFIYKVDLIQTSSTTLPKAVSLFMHRVVNKVQPGASITFGSIEGGYAINDELEKNDELANEVKKQLKEKGLTSIYLFYLNYEDSVTKNKKKASFCMV